MDKKMFLAGATGLLGSNIMVHPDIVHNIIANYHTRKIQEKTEKLDTSNLDLENYEVLNSYFYKNDFELIINCVAFTNVDGCEQDKSRADRENVKITENLACIAEKYGIKLVHISTDHLFDGSEAMLDENANPSPVNEYARTKLKAEQSVLNECPNALIVRTNFYGWGPSHRQSFSDWIITSLKNNTKISMYNDIFSTPIYVQTLITLIFKLISLDETGIYNIVGSERISKYEFGLKIANKFNLSKKLISEATYDASTCTTERPDDMSLSNKKLSEILSVSIEVADQGIEKMFNDQKNKMNEQIKNLY